MAESKRGGREATEAFDYVVCLDRTTTGRIFKRVSQGNLVGASTLSRIHRGLWVERAYVLQDFFIRVFGA